MTNKNKKHHDDQKGGVNPIVAAVTGAVVGVAVAGIAGAAVMANDGTRKKVEKAIDEAKDNINNMRKDVDKKSGQGQKKVSKVVATVKDAKQDVVKDTK